MKDVRKYDDPMYDFDREEKDRRSSLLFSLSIALIALGGLFAGVHLFAIERRTTALEDRVIALEMASREGFERNDDIGPGPMEAYPPTTMDQTSNTAVKTYPTPTPSKNPTPDPTPTPHKDPTPEPTPTPSKDPTLAPTLTSSSTPTPTPTPTQETNSNPILQENSGKDPQPYDSPID